MKKKTIVALLAAMVLGVTAGGMKELPYAYADADKTNLVADTGAATKFEVKPGVATKITIPVRATEDHISNPKFSVILSEDAPIEVKEFDVYQLTGGMRSEENYITTYSDCSRLTFYVLTDEIAKIGEYDFTIVYEDVWGDGLSVKEGDKEYKQRMTLTAVVKEEKLPAELAISNIKVRGKAEPGGEISVSFQLTNTGEITARNVRLSADYGAAGGQLVPNYTDYTKRLGELYQGDSVLVSLQIKVLKNVSSNLVQLPLDIVYKDSAGNEYRADVNNILYLEITLPEEEKEQFENGTLLINNVKQTPAKPKAGQKVSLSFDMENTGEKDYTDAKVYLNYVSNTGFEPVNAEPYQYVGTIKAGKKKTVTVEVKAGKDIPAGLNKLGMNYTYKDGREEEASGMVELYVLNVIEAVKEETTVSRPKLMVSEFSTSSDVIKSGEEFDFNFTVYNTHSELAAKNIKITVNSELFSVTKGSNSFFLREIKPGQDGEITINLKASAAAMTGSYPVNIQMEYEYDGMPASEANAGGVLVTETKMILVKENLRVSVENVMIGWGTTYVNQPTPLSFSIYNMGKSTLNNVYFTVEGDYAVANGSSYYYGSLQAGYPDYVEMDIMPLVAGDAVGTLTIHMEDSNGDEVTYTSELTGFVMEMGGGDIGFEDPGMDIPVDVPPMEEPEEPAKPIVSLPIFAVILVAVFLVSFFAAWGIKLGCYKKKNRYDE
ncbi:MAG: hypothetical protein IJZ55_12650 [Lachnospiraceae bacterium]|nr:hypothetical protein [Lachnospiraceae bacterium]